MLQLSSKDGFSFVLEGALLNTIHGKDTVEAFISLSLMLAIHRFSAKARQTRRPPN